MSGPPCCRRVRVFRFASGKLRASYDESIEAANDLQRSDTEQFKLDNIDFGRRSVLPHCCSVEAEHGLGYHPNSQLKHCQNM